MGAFVLVRRPAAHATNLSPIPLIERFGRVFLDGKHLGNRYINSYNSKTPLFLDEKLTFPDDTSSLLPSTCEEFMIFKKQTFLVLSNRNYDKYWIGMLEFRHTKKQKLEVTGNSRTKQTPKQEDARLALRLERSSLNILRLGWVDTNC